MKVTIEKGFPAGRVTAPPSKSYGHRMLICAALSGGKSIVNRISGSEDMLATLDCLSALGIRYRAEEERICFEGKTEPELPAVYNCRESGSTLRFFIPIALAYTGGGIFRGAERLMERGVGIYEEIFSPHGITFEKTADSITVKGELKAGEYKVRGDISSQFISGLLFALPSLSGDSIIEVLPPVESRAYIDITIDAMKHFGVEIEETKENTFFVKGGQKYLEKEATVEGDWSNAAFLYAFNSLGADLDINGLNMESIQGDKACTGFFKELEEPGAVIDISNCPDLGPILFTVAATKHGARFTGIRRLRIKESDRAKVMADELSKFGAECVIEENEMSVGCIKGAPREALSGHNDHRIVMSMAVLLTLTGGTVEGAEAVRKSYPDFFDVIKAAGVKVTTE